MRVSKVKDLLNRLYERKFDRKARIEKISETTKAIGDPSSVYRKMDEALESAYRSEVTFIEEQITDILEAMGGGI